MSLFFLHRGVSKVCDNLSVAKLSDHTMTQ